MTTWRLLWQSGRQSSSLHHPFTSLESSSMPSLPVERFAKTVIYRIAFCGNLYENYKGPKSRTNKTNNFMIFILMFVENCLLYDAIYNFSVWPRISSNPSDINRCRSHTEKNIFLNLFHLNQYTN